jgi:hypothetical protein
MILAMCWVPRGAAKTLPTVYKASEEEMRGLMGRYLFLMHSGGTCDLRPSLHHPHSHLAAFIPKYSMSLNGKGSEAEVEAEAEEGEDEISKKYNLDDYDDEGGGKFHLWPLFILFYSIYYILRHFLCS